MLPKLIVSNIWKSLDNTVLTAIDGSVTASPSSPDSSCKTVFAKPDKRLSILSLKQNQESEYRVKAAMKNKLLYAHL